MLKRSGWHYLARRNAAHFPCCSNRASCRRCPDVLSPLSIPLSCQCSSIASAASSLCAASRTHSSAQTPPSVATSIPASKPPQRDARRLRLKTPEVLSHESLSYAECPVCGAQHHMHDMLVHIQAIHKDQDPAYWKEQCDARLALYERVIGIPLAAATRSSAAFDAALLSGIDSLQLSTAMARDPLSGLGAYRSLLPTITGGGAYECNWCTVKHAPFPTRDAFLKHVAKDHPVLDFDLVESLVPMPSSPPEAKKAEEPAAASSWSWRPSGEADRSDEASDAADAAASMVHPGPSRRMPGVKTVMESNAASIRLLGQQRGLSVPRAYGYDGQSLAPPHIATYTNPHNVAAAPSSGTETEAVKPFFREKYFPCELCNKVFSSELNLLQHLEGKHAPPPLDSLANATTPLPAKGMEASADTSATSILPDSSPASAAAESNANTPSTICVTCDLCRHTEKTFTLPSALFAHIRFRHRTVDATYEAERMMQAQRTRKARRCPYCPLSFPDVTVLQSHVWSQHHKRIDISALLGEDQAAGTQEAVPSQDAALALKYACPSLPAFSMKTRWWCNTCKRGFATPSALGAHNHEKHETVSELYPCPACRRIFKDLVTLEEHVKLSHKSVQLVDLGLKSTSICTFCNRGFLSPEALHAHSVAHHGKDPHKPVRSFAAPGASALAGEGSGVSVNSGSATTADTAPSTIAAPPKPRKVSRSKKLSSTST